MEPRKLCIQNMTIPHRWKQTIPEQMRKVGGVRLTLLICLIRLINEAIRTPFKKSKPIKADDEPLVIIINLGTKHDVCLCFNA